ncbi:MAG: ABC transporter permease [Dysgonamonadaceae bacterium]|nr:ABC transporter permease [Dysgonamonadaceae bacterium]MDD4727482.1 ABC transporter permease [Dysgonamonadaceae bacterium]
MSDSKQSKIKFRHLRNIVSVLVEEYKRMLKDSGVMLIILGAAFLYPLLYSYVYLNETIRDMPIAVVDQSNTVRSRNFIKSIDATPDLQVTHTYNNLEEVKDPFYKGQIHGVLLIPADFSERINKKQQATVSTYSDMSSFLYYRTMALGVNFAMLDQNDQIKIERLNSMGKVGREAEIAAAPFTYKDVILYNEGMGYGSFLIPALLVLVIHQTLFFGIGMSTGTAREEDSFYQLIPPNSGRSIFHVVVGKALCFFSWYLVVSVYVLGFIPKLFNQPHIGNPLDIAILIIPFLLAATFFAMTLSVFIRNRETGFVVFLFTSLILLFLSGTSWPRSSMGQFWVNFSYLFPSTFGINGYVKINSMGANITQICDEYIGLWIQAGVYFITTMVVYKWQIGSSVKRNR